MQTKTSAPPKKVKRPMASDVWLAYTTYILHTAKFGHLIQPCVGNSLRTPTLPVQELGSETNGQVTPNNSYCTSHKRQVVRSTASLTDHNVSEAFEDVRSLMM